MKMTATIDAPPGWGSPTFRTFPKKLMIKKQGRDRHQKLLIPLQTFEVLAFPVRVRRIEPLETRCAAAVPDSFAIKTGKPSGCYA